MKSSWALPLLVASACAKGSAGGIDAAVKFDGPNQLVDGAELIDAPSGPDAAMAITLSETQNSTLFYGGSVACGNSTSGNTVDNIWYRAFQLSDAAAIQGGFHITSIDFAVQDAVGSLAINVKIGSYSGALDGATLNTGMISSLATAQTTPPNTSGMTGEMVNVPIVADIPAGGKFVVQIVAPNMDSGTTQHALYIGTTQSTQTHAWYWSSAGCSQSTPTKVDSTIASGNLILNVNGTH